jgi:hypothetical protein
MALSTLVKRIVCNNLILHFIYRTDCRSPDTVAGNSAQIRQPLPLKNANETPEAEKVPFLVAERIREAFLDEIFRPGDHLGGGRTGGEI